MKNLTKVVVLGVVFVALFFVADSVSAATVQFHLRHQSTIFFEGEAEVPVAGFTTLTDSDGVGHDVNMRSVLNVLSNIDNTSNAFRISTLQYFTSFSSFYVKCIEVAAPFVNACDNWQYVVDGTYPSVGMDSYVLSGGENVWIYFGDIRRVRLNGGTVYTTKSELKAEQYQYEVNRWVPVTGYTIGIKKDGKVVATQAVDSQGMATFTTLEPGNYTTGLVEDFYFPSTAFYVGLSVPSLGSTGSAAPPPPSSPEPEQSVKTFSVEKALAFLKSFQNADGSLGDAPMLTDWAAIAGLNLQTYLLSDPSPGTLLTDYERRAMALMALGINPYSGTPTNYIEKILKEFDGTQFGDANLVNDDIFALIPLLKAGYTASDGEVQKSVAVILTGQGQNGAWIDTDLTAAAVQALEPVSSLAGVQEALDKAKTYLELKENEAGSFGNAYSTSWAMQALKALGENVSSSSFAAFQAEDGGLLKDDSLNNRIWATAYAIPAAEGKSWGTILQSFEKPAISAEILLAIQTEVQRIELAVAALEPQVALLYNQYLARVEQEQKVAVITQEIARVQEVIEEPAPPEIVQQELVHTQGAAAVAEVLPRSEGLGMRQIALLVIAGFAIFFLAGGTNLVFPLLKKIMIRV